MSWHVIDRRDGERVAGGFDELADAEAWIEKTDRRGSDEYEAIEDDPFAGADAHQLPKPGERQSEYEDRTGRVTDADEWRRLQTPELADRIGDEGSPRYCPECGADVLGNDPHAADCPETHCFGCGAELETPESSCRACGYPAERTAAALTPIAGEPAAELEPAPAEIVLPLSRAEAELLAAIVDFGGVDNDNLESLERSTAEAIADLLRDRLAGAGPATAGELAALEGIQHAQNHALALEYALAQALHIVRGARWTDDGRRAAVHELEQRLARVDELEPVARWAQR